VLCLVLRRAPGEPLGLDLQIQAEEGAGVVRRVAPGSIAARSGLRLGDTVASINEQPLAGCESPADLISPSVCVVRIGVLRPTTQAAAMLLAQHSAAAHPWMHTQHQQRWDPHEVFG